MNILPGRRRVPLKDGVLIYSGVFSGPTRTVTEICVSEDPTVPFMMVDITNKEVLKEFNSAESDRYDGNDNPMLFLITIHVLVEKLKLS